MYYLLTYPQYLARNFECCYTKVQSAIQSKCCYIKL